jgi:pimeloyl-ACP methyl ester carboxylesterase
MSAPQLTFPPPPKLHTTTVFGRSIKYYDVGSGPPLLLIHGLGGDADEWAFCFEPLSQRHRVLALDLLGFGRSDKPLIDYTIAGFVEVVDRSLKTLGVERPTLIGSSLGGWIASAFALKHPDSISKLVLADSAGVWANLTELGMDPHVSTRAHMSEVFDRVFHDKRLVTDELVDLAYEQHLARGDGHTIASLVRNLGSGGERLDSVISRIQAPTLIVWGQQDEIIPLAAGELTHQLIRGSELVVIPECGHVPALEKPAEFVEHVVRFLNS